GTAGRRAGLSHESGERRGAGVVSRISDGIEGRDRATQGVILRRSIAAIKLTGDAHLVEVGVTGEREEAGVRVLPTEASGSRHSAGFDRRNLDERPYDASRLAGLNGCDGVAVDGLNEAIAKGVESGAESPDVFERGDVQALLDGGCDRPKLNQRLVLVTGGIDKDAVDQMPGSQFPDLADGADVRIVVA